MTKKVKLAEAAKDLKIENQELIDFLEKYDGTKRKNTTALTDEEMNIILENYSQKNQVESFDDYFESKNKPLKSDAEKEEEKSVKKETVKKAASKPKILGARKQQIRNRFRLKRNRQGKKAPRPTLNLSKQNQII